MKKRAVYMYLAMCLALALSVTGCSKKTVSSDGVRTVEKDYTKGQIMVVAATERNRYQNIYTSQLWSVKADDSGATFEEKLLGQIEQFLIELGTTNLMAVSYTHLERYENMFRHYDWKYHDKVSAQIYYSEPMSHLSLIHIYKVGRTLPYGDISGGFLRTDSGNGLSNTLQRCLTVIYN